MENKTRGKKASKQQQKVILNFLQQNTNLLLGKSTPLDLKRNNILWNELVIKLNEIPGGARKDRKQWKLFFSEWKSKIKKKARENKQNIFKTEAGTYNCSNLSELENRLINLIGWGTIVGNTATMPELDSADVKFIEAEDAIYYHTEEEETIKIEEEEIQYDTEWEQPNKNSSKRSRNESDLISSAKIYSDALNNVAAAINNLSNSMFQCAEKIVEALNKK